MAGLDPAIHVFGTASKKNVDARVKPGHDEMCWCADVPSTVIASEAKQSSFPSPRQASWIASSLRSSQ
jgi:hypothetical protein